MNRSMNRFLMNLDQRPEPEAPTWFAPVHSPGPPILAIGAVLALAFQSDTNQLGRCDQNEAPSPDQIFFGSPF